jgi:hypothetical protein
MRSGFSVIGLTGAAVVTLAAETAVGKVGFDTMGLVVMLGTLLGMFVALVSPDAWHTPASGQPHAVVVPDAAPVVAAGPRPSHPGGS